LITRLGIGSIVAVTGSIAKQPLAVVPFIKYFPLLAVEGFAYEVVAEVSVQYV
jgi:hypothetical protein